MKIRLEDLVNSIQGFQSLVKLQLPVKQSYAISKLAKRVEKEMKFYNSERDKLFNTLGESNGNGLKNIKPENVEEFQNKIKELGDMEIDIDVKLIPIIWLENEKLTAADFISLNDFLAGSLD